MLCLTLYLLAAVIAAAVYAGHRYARELDTERTGQADRQDKVDVGQTQAAEPRKGISDKYLETLALYYEEEIEGEAYFHQAARLLDDPEEARKMRLLGDVETVAADAVRPLIDKYGLVPRDADVLRADGKSSASNDTRDWSAHVSEMSRTFPGYIDDFLNLEAMAPAEDLPRLKILTEHEVAAIEFLDLERAGKPDSDRPLRRYLGQL